MEDNAKMSINERYPGHTRALAKAGLNMNFSNFEVIVDKADNMEKN